VATSLSCMSRALALAVPFLLAGPVHAGEPEPCVPSAVGSAPGNGLAYQLDDLARMASARHPSVAAKQAGVAVGQAELSAARSQYLPSPSVQGSPGAGGGHTTVWSVQQPLWTAGRLQAGVDAAQARTQSAQEALVETQQSLGLAVTNAYQALAQARGRSETLRRLIARLNGYREGMQRRVEGGVSAQGELELLQARQALASGQFKAACHAERSARAQLASLVDMPLGVQDVGVATVATDLPDMDALLASSLERSPVLRRLEQDRLAARADADAKASAQWPSVALVAQRSLPQGVPNAVRSTSVGVQLQYTPGAGFSSTALARAAEAQVESLRANREAAVADLTSRIRTEHEEFQSALSRREDGQATARAAAQVLASFERLFAAGKRSWLDVMNAARELSDAELALADIEAQMTASRYRLDLLAANPAWMQARP